jgi:hypothetical protein
MPLDDMRVHLIGDPHLGKDFDKHAPTHRRGERATKQMAQFIDELHHPSDIIVMVGDLFDHPGVSNSIVVGAARAVLAAAESRPDTIFIMMAGNHDLPRNLTRVGAWTTFTKMLEDRMENLVIARWPMVVARIAVFPWEWDRTAAEQVGDLAGWPADAAIGHWDLEMFDDDGSHMAPVEELRSAFGQDVILRSGHFHKPGVYGEVICTGSMQPMSHGEDPDEQFYVTRTLEQVLAAGDDLRDKHVRVLVKPGEEIPEIDCLGVTHLRVREETENHPVTLSPSNFDWTKRLSDRIKNLKPAVRDFIVERMPDVDPDKQRGSSASPDSESEGMGNPNLAEVQPDRSE